MADVWEKHMVSHGRKANFKARKQQLKWYKEKNRKKVCLHIQTHSLLKIQAFWQNIQIWKIARNEVKNTICYSFENYSLKFSWEMWISRRNSRFNLKDASAVGIPLWLSCKESTCNAGDLGATSGLGRSLWEGKGYPLQYSGLENSVDCIVHGFAKSQTRLSIFQFLHFSAVSRNTHTEKDHSRLRPGEVILLFQSDVEGDTPH